MDFQTLAYDTCRRYVRDNTSQVGSDVTNLILGWIRNRDINRLSSCSDHILQAYGHSEVLYRYTRQVAAFFKKNAAFSDDAVCDAAAQSAFFEAEKVCRITNKRLDYYYRHPERIEPELLKDIERCQSIIHDILGGTVDYLEKLPEYIKVTSGATATRPRSKSQPFRKIRFRNLPASPRTHNYLRALARYFGQDRISFKSIWNNRVVTVPKNWKTHRTIACEPEGNLILQLSLDGYVKDRLRRKARIDLSDQSLNQRLAKVGSVDGSFATIDLSMASDTIAFNTVAYLLPSDWFKIFNDYRTPCGEGFGTRFEYAKFSSMGNGATFSLESLIFGGIVKAVCHSDPYAVYGDDLVVPTGVVPRLLKLLRFFGFTVNSDKSFVSGPFRESCGEDYYEGRLITPTYMRGSNPLLIELVHSVNSLAAIANSAGQLEEYLLDIVEDYNLPVVPYMESTIVGVWVDPHTAYTLGKVKNRSWIPSVKGYSPKTRKIDAGDSRGLFMWYLYHLNSHDAINIPHPYLSGMKEWSNFSPSTTSEVPYFTHKFTRKWVGWRIPSEVTPSHLFWWGEQIVRRKAD